MVDRRTRLENDRGADRWNGCGNPRRARHGHIASVTETDRTDATYNLTVAGFETYFVGEQRVLVHNCNIRMKGEGAARRTTGTKEEISSAVSDALGDAQKRTCVTCSPGTLHLIWEFCC